jgi:ABC-type Mn2+/Zn2+ transport system permease subunit/Mn-dependent DtxR family transcriptional regulator
VAIIHFIQKKQKMLENLVQVLQQDYAQRALLASAMVGIMCGLLGCFIVLRNMSLIGDALSHAILPGVVVAFMVVGYNVMGFFIGSVIAGLLAAVLITWIQRNVKTREDAVIGIVFTSMFATGVMGISWLTRQQGVHLDLKDFLFGNILGISNQDLWLTFLVMLFCIICIIAFYRYFFITTFGSVVANTLGISSSTIHYFLMLLLSFSVVASLQSVGVILVVAMLITPASAAYLLTQRLKIMLVISAGIGVFAAISGLLIAIIFETTPGPAMTLMATFAYLMAILFSPQKGLVSKWLKQYRMKQKVEAEDVLKQSIKLLEISALNLSNLKEKLQISNFKLKSILNRLQKEQMITISDNFITLTEKGHAKGYDLVRAHRLWETFLVNEMGLNTEQIHDDAEKFEHLLPDSLLQEVERKLGYPQLDPHGSPIPRKPAKDTTTLSLLKAGESAVINAYQFNQVIIKDLWELGLHPNLVFSILKIESGMFLIQIEEREVSLHLNVAEKVSVEKII